ncbi:MAG: hypothetical protein FWG16_05745, partial [Micrococcales bacterium]|nr:hypothetical protein [Micrococcales bacterium]
MPTALAAVAVLVLCLGYLLPHVAKRRHQASMVPVEDRFSEAARLIEPASPAQPDQTESSKALLAPPTSARNRQMNRPPASPVRPVLPAGRPTPGAKVPAKTRPAQSPQVRAAKIRGAAAVGFLGLTLVTAILTFVGLPWFMPAVTLGCFGVVLVAGRRAAVANAKPAGARPQAKSIGQAGAVGLPDAVASKPANSYSSRPRQDSRPVLAQTQGRAQGQTQGRAVAQGQARTQGQGQVLGRRRPGMSGRIVAGQTTDFHLPEPLVITEVETGSVFSSVAD